MAPNLNSGKKAHTLKSPHFAPMLVTLNYQLSLNSMLLTMSSPTRPPKHKDQNVENTKKYLNECVIAYYVIHIYVIKKHLKGVQDALFLRVKRKVYVYL